MMMMMMMMMVITKVMVGVQKTGFSFGIGKSNVVNYIVWSPSDDETTHDDDDDDDDGMTRTGMIVIKRFSKL
jgi:hypothetical protein